MPKRTRPLLCELHAHSSWSDGDLELPELVDLYGSAGFDVLAVTDHVVREDRPRPPSRTSVSPANHGAYIEHLEEEAERAWSLYRLLVIPGLELTYDAPDACTAAHALALGLRSFVGLEHGLDDALARARSAGAALVAAHPYTLAASADAPRTTARFAEQPDWAAQAVDRFELCNRHDFFGWVAEARLPAVASGDFHRLEHLATWKTLVPAEKREDAVVEYLRSRKPVSLVPMGLSLADVAA